MKFDAYTPEADLIQATREDGRTRLRIHRPGGVCAVLGRGSKADEEVHLDACLADGVKVLRRRGGGCAVVLDPGNLVVQLSQRVDGLGGHRRHFRRLSDWLVSALAAAGVKGLVRAGISDLAIGDRKVAGACMHRSRDVLLYSASILVQPDLTLMDRYLRHPPREPDYRRGRTHLEFVQSLHGAGLWKEAPGMLAEILERRGGPGQPG
jgi:lipoate-protein ligase A